MNLESAIRAEHSKTLCDRIVRHIGDNGQRFAELMELFFNGESRIVQRAAWPMSYCVRNHSTLIQPYLKKLLDLLTRKDVHPAVTRNIVRLLQYVDIPKRYQGKLMSICFHFIEKPGEKAAVKAFSLTILENMLCRYPEILPEIKAIIEARWEQETAAFHSRAKRLLKRNKPD